MVLAADTRDILLVIGASLSGETLTAADLYPRPERPQKQAMTVAEFDIVAFQRKLAGS